MKSNENGLSLLILIGRTRRRPSFPLSIPISYYFSRFQRASSIVIAFSVNSVKISSSASSLVLHWLFSTLLLFFLFSRNYDATPFMEPTLHSSVSFPFFPLLPHSPSIPWPPILSPSLSLSFFSRTLSPSLSLLSAPQLCSSYLHSTQIPTPSHHRCHYTSWSKWADALPRLTYHRPYLRYPASQIPRSKTGTLPSTRPSVSGLNYLAANPMSRRPWTTV